MVMVPQTREERYASRPWRHGGGCAAEWKQRSGSASLVTQAAAADGRTETLFGYFRNFSKLSSVLISRRHVGSGDGVRGAAGGALASGADGSREGRARRAELLQLQQTGARDAQSGHASS